MSKVRNEDDDDVSPPPSHPTNNFNPKEQEPTTPTPQRPLLVSDELRSSNLHDAKTSFSASDNAPADDVVVHITSEGEESNIATAQPSTEENGSDIGSPTQDVHDNRADPSHEGVEPQSSPIPSAENHRFIICNTNMTKLYQAALKGDWKTAKAIFDVDSSASTMKINNREDTALHIAAAAKNISFVEKYISFVEKLEGSTTSSVLAAQNIRGNTALTFAAVSGVLRIAEVMVDKNAHLPNISDNRKQTPVLLAIAYKRKDMASYLFSKTNFKALDHPEQIELLISSISSDYYDIALDILQKKPELATERMKENSDSALHLLARKPSSIIGSSNQLSFWKRHINSRFNRIYNKALMQTLAHQTVEHIWNSVVKEHSKYELSQFIEETIRLCHEAARVGNAEFLIILIRSYPDLLWKFDRDNKNIFHVAVENRQESVFSLIYEIRGLSDFLANFYDQKTNSNMLHLAGMLATPYQLSRVSGAALQMQRELLWFKEVEKMVISSHLKMRSAMKRKEDPLNTLTPRELFTKEHKELRKEGEEWMKNTANSCMLVATLIATVVFAAAFTVPGGNISPGGTPTFRDNHAFTVFVISDVTALVLSSTSILTFLSILTSRYAEDDFLMSLPMKLLFGLVTLFISISCMVVAFSATFFIAYDQTKAKIPLGIVIVGILPVVCFCVFHSKLVRDILRSAYWSTFSLRKRKKKLF